tara:strand:+ start:53390 stop:53635 length:246 start_codon:yes stop_codon:yes gene_type:complete
MAKSNTTTLLAATKSAVNKAKYYTTKEKKALALRLLAQLTAEVEALEVVKTQSKNKTTTAKGLSKMTKAQLLEVIKQQQGS